MVGHCEDEQAFALVRRADFFRREESSLNLETQSVKVSPDAFRPAGREHTCDVFDDDEPRARLDDDAPRRRPEVALVVLAEALSGQGMRLARDAANDAIHETTPLSASEGFDIAPNRSGSHETLLHRCDQLRAAEGFPLHQHDRASAWDCQLESEIETAASGAKADDVEAAGEMPGTQTHIHAALIPAANSQSAARTKPCDG
jgi:hypothetical protein